MIKERRKTAKGEAEREGGREGWMERNGEGGSREQASALHVLKGQMVTAGNWGANHSAGHRARDQRREGDRGREESEHMQRSRGEEHLRGSCTLALTEREREGGEDWVLLLHTNKEAESKKRGKDRDRGDAEIVTGGGKSIPPSHLQRYRDKEGGKTKGAREIVEWGERTGDS